MTDTESKFEISVLRPDGTMDKRNVRFRSPVRREFTEYKNHLIRVQKQTQDADDETKMKLAGELEDIHFALFVKLDVSGVLKPEDAENVAQDDFHRMTAWLIEKMRGDYSRFLQNAAQEPPPARKN